MPNPQKISEKTFQSPRKYIQGPTAIKNAAKYLGKLGKKPLIACDPKVYDIVGKDLIAILIEEGFTVTRAEFGGEITNDEINRISGLGKESDFIVGLGGGKTSDTAKAVGNQLNIPIAIIPTTASTDAPCSALSVIYSPSGEFERYWFFDVNPDIVLVDTGVIARAPPRFLAAGIGDAFATNIEAKLCRTSLNCVGGLQTEVAAAIGNKCEEILLKYGKQAYEANKAQVVTPAFEAVVEANTLMSGLGFESGGVAAAHSIHNGLTAIHGTHHLLHGEKVAFGTVAQLILINTPSSELDIVLGFLRSVDLPITFKHLGIPDVTNEELRQVAKLSCAPEETIWNMESLINEEVVFHAIKGADSAGRDYLARTGQKL